MRPWDPTSFTCNGTITYAHGGTSSCRAWVSPTDDDVLYAAYLVGGASAVRQLMHPEYAAYLL